MSESTDREKMYAQYPEEMPQWEALCAAVMKASQDIWSDGESPHLAMYAQWGTLPAPLYTSTLSSPCADVGFNDEVEALLEFRHDMHHGVDPETGMGPMSETMSFSEALDRDLVPDEIRENIETVMERTGIGPEDVVLVSHTTTHDLDGLPTAPEVEYDFSNETKAAIEEALQLGDDK